MTKDVLVTVSGIQRDIEEEPIELITSGTHYLKNGKHYVLYEEQADQAAPVIKNRVKFNENSFEMTKRGGPYTALSFFKGEKTSSVYSTPAGPVQIDVFTHEISVTETEGEILAVIQYSLNINYNFISECEVRFKVQAR